MHNNWLASMVTKYGDVERVDWTKAVDGDWFMVGVSCGEDDALREMCCFWDL